MNSISHHVVGSGSIRKASLRSLRLVAPAVIGVCVAGAFAQNAAIVGFQTGNGLSIIDTSTNTVTGTIPASGEVDNFCVTPDLSTLYAVVPGAGVDVIDLVTHSVVKTIPISGSVFGCRVTPDGSRVFVTRGDPHTVFVIDTATNTIISELPTNANAVYLDISPDGNTVYVSTSVIFHGTTISAIDVPTLDMQVIDIGVYPAEVKVSPEGAYLYISNEFANTVTIMDTGTNAVVKTLAVGSGPRGITFTPDGSKAYVVTAYDGSITVIDTATQEVDHAIPLGGGTPYYIAILDDGQTGYVTKWSNQTVSVLDLATETITTEIGVSGKPYDILLVNDPSNPCPVGDMNGDEVVDITDLAILLAHYGDTESVYRHGDIDADGDVDLSDLAALLSVYGTTCH
jgi:YVTN family beta-propeller protein